ncbi:MAG TPA: YceH family protein [Ilumatobacteraceae bacterium]|nr:YceH family protein [Ilumatobacteraceae bacterium]
MLTVIEGRVLGCLMEKERTVPDQYPLSMNALVLACNQSSSRDPIMALDEHEVDASITSMKSQGLVRIVHPSHGRSVTRYRQVADEKFGLDDEPAAVVAVLLVRGPQTAAELRARTERLHPFDSVNDVERCLHDLVDHGLVRLLERQTGQKEQRWQQLIADEIEPVAGVATMLPAAVAGSMADRVAQLEERVAKLEASLADLL